MFSRPPATRVVRHALLGSAFLFLALLSACGGGGGGGGGSHAASASAATPHITSLSPNQVPSGSPGITLTVKGSNFTQSSYIQWNGQSFATTFISSNELQVTISEKLLASGMNVSISVVTTGSPAVTSNAVQFTIVQGPFELTSVSPESIPLGSDTVDITIRGDGFIGQESVYWNDTKLDSAMISGTEITATVPANLLQSPGSGAIQVIVPPGIYPRAYTNRLPVAIGYDTKIVEQDANDIVWDSVHKKTYISIPIDANTNPDSIATLDLATGAVTPVLSKMHDPDSLALSDDDSYLYAGTDLDGAIKRFSLPDLTQDLNIDLAGIRFLTAGSIEAAPGHPHTIVVSLLMPDYQYSYTPGGEIFDDGTARKLLVGSSYNYFNGYSFQWNTDNTSIYVASGQFGYDFETFSVSGSNLVGTGYYSDLLSSNWRTGKGIHYDPDRDVIFDDDGVVVDPMGNVVGNFSLPDSAYTQAVISSSANRAFFAGPQRQFGEIDIWKFNLTTEDLIGKAVIAAPDLNISLDRIIWINQDTLALIVSLNTLTQQTRHKEIYLLSGLFAQP